MNNWSAGWAVWGMAFDHKGVPNHARNFNHSPIMVDVEKAIVHYHPSYYNIAQFSKYVQSGAQRIGFQSDAAALHVAAFQNPDGQVVVVALNSTDQAQAAQVKIGKRYVPLSLAGHSI
jgi:glucosylceramidase